MWVDYVIGKLPHYPALQTLFRPQSHHFFSYNHPSKLTYYTRSATTTPQTFSQNGIPYPNLNFCHRISCHLSSFRRCLAPHQARQLPQLLDRFVQGRARPWSFPRHRYRQMDFQGWNGVGGQAGGSFRMFRLHNVLTLCGPKVSRQGLTHRHRPSITTSPTRSFRPSLN